MATVMRAEGGQPAIGRAASKATAGLRSRGVGASALPAKGRDLAVILTTLFVVQPQDQVAAGGYEGFALFAADGTPWSPRTVPAARRSAISAAE